MMSYKQFKNIINSYGISSYTNKELYDIYHIAKITKVDIMSFIDGHLDYFCSDIEITEPINLTYMFFSYIYDDYVVIADLCGSDNNYPPKVRKLVSVAKMYHKMYH